MQGKDIKMFEHLVVGDEIYLETNELDTVWRKVKATKITPTLFVVDTGNRFNRIHGSEVGSASKYHPAHVFFLSDPYASKQYAEYRAEVELKSLRLRIRGAVETMDTEQLTTLLLTITEINGQSV